MSNNSNNTTRLLADFVRQSHWSPFQNNLACCGLMIVFAKLCLEGLRYWNAAAASGDQQSNSKPGLYGLLSACLFFWPLFDYNVCWSWRLNCIVPAAVLLRCLLLRQQFGPAVYAAVLVVLGLYRFMTAEAAVIVAAVGVGDTLAPLVGINFGRHVYHMPLTNSKTMEGSVVGVFLGTCAGCYFLLYTMGIALLPLRIVLAYAGIAAMVEGSSPETLDNVMVPLALHFSMDRVQAVLGNWTKMDG